MNSTTRDRFQAVVCAILFCAFFIGSLSGPLAQRSDAALFTLTDGNSIANFDTSSQANAYGWSVDGIGQLFQQAFWFRVGNVAEQSLDVLPIGLQGTTDTDFDGNPDTLFVRYNGGGFDVEVRYVLDGGSPGSGASDMGEQISIISRSQDPLDFHFFQYSDFDLQGTIGGDSGVFTNLNAVRQYEGAIRLTETVVTPVPSHRELAFYSSTITKLNDAVATTLDDLPAIGTVLGPGDLTWAFQWDFALPAGSTFQISKDKNLSAGTIPEPATLALLMAGVALLLSKRRAR